MLLWCIYNHDQMSEQHTEPTWQSTNEHRQQMRLIQSGCDTKHVKKKRVSLLQVLGTIGLHHFNEKSTRVKCSFGFGSVIFNEMLASASLANSFLLTQPAKIDHLLLGYLD